MHYWEGIIKMKLIIAGSRNITDYQILVNVIKLSGLNITEVVSGTAYGVDKMGERWAKENNIPIKQFPANWSAYGKSAGYRRNEEMADYADGLLALWDGESKGTKHMINIAKAQGLKVHVYKDP